MSEFKTRADADQPSPAGGGASHESTTVSLELSAAEQEILREVLAALKSIRYGSILLTIHEGRLVEVSKTVRSRMGAK